MLSQKITKTCLYLAKAETPKAASTFQLQLQEALNLWVRSHQGLQQGDAELGLPGHNSSEVVRLFTLIEPHHRAMVAAVRAILAAPEDGALLEGEIHRLRVHESRFLKGMDEIVFRYDWEANEKVEFASRLEWGLMVVTLLVLALEALFIFAPATRRIQLDMQELAECEEDLKRLFAVSPTALLLVESKGLEILGLNRKALELLGLSPEGFSPRNLRGHLSEECHNSNRGFLARVGLGEEIQGMEVVFTGGDGALRETLASARGLNFLGRALIVVGITDITQIRQAERERQMMASRLSQAQKLESVGRLAAGIAHEINTPAQYVGINIQFLRESFAELDRCLAILKRLSAVTVPGAMESLLAEAKRLRGEIDLDYLMTEIPKAIDQSQEGVDRIATIVQAMNLFSHPGGARKVPTDLNRAIQATLEISRNQWRFCANLTTELAPDLPLVPGFPAEINQAILNPIVNAVHAIEEQRGENATEKGAIRIQSRRDGAWVEIRTADDGCGIPDAIKSKVFAPFFTTETVGKGMGQGLSLAYAAIVEKHGGTLELTSEAGLGTTAIIRLPLVESG